MDINRRAYVGTLDLFEAENTTSIEPIIQAINEVFNDTINEQVLE